MAEPVDRTSWGSGPRGGHGVGYRMMSSAAPNARAGRHTSTTTRPRHDRPRQDNGGRYASKSGFSSKGSWGADPQTGSRTISADAVAQPLPQGMSRGTLWPAVSATKPRWERWLAIAKQYGTPLYMFEEDVLRDRIRQFQQAVDRNFKQSHIHYAMKSNPTPAIVKVMQSEGLGADASSGMELELALRVGFSKIVLSGPAKTDDELQLALKHQDRVTILADSLRELERIQQFAAKQNITARVGVRVSDAAHGAWTKFGVPLPELPDVLGRAGRLRAVRVEGLQFHVSWARSADRHVQTLRAVGRVLQELPQPVRRRLAFLDIGGGYYPDGDEASYPWLAGSQDLVLPSSLPDLDQWWGSDQPFYALKSVEPLPSMMKRISQAVQEHIRPHADVKIWFEPGRWLCNPCVHILLTVVDKKSDRLAIADGGTNLLGWERMEMEYAPLVNLSRPSNHQRRCVVYGSLCTPHDLWGYSCYGQGVREGDVLALLFQGSYVQTLQQRFIKPLAGLVSMDAKGNATLSTPHEQFPDRFRL